MGLGIGEIISGVVGGLGNTAVAAGTADQKARHQAYVAEQQLKQQQADAKQATIMNFAFSALQAKQNKEANTTKVVLIVSGVLVFSIVLILAVNAKRNAQAA